MTYYDCKFERERKQHPTHWVIMPCGYTVYKLVFIGPALEPNSAYI